MLTSHITMKSAIFRDFIVFASVSDNKWIDLFQNDSLHISKFLQREFSCYYLKKKTLISLSSKTSPFHHKRSHILVSRIVGHNEVNSGQHSLNMFPHVSQIVNIAFWNEIVKWNSCLKRFVLNFPFRTFLSLTKL